MRRVFTPYARRVQIFGPIGVLHIRATSAPAQINHFNLDDFYFHSPTMPPLIVTVGLAGSLLRTLTETNFFRSLTRPI
jgi:hypothetical protein